MLLDLLKGNNDFSNYTKSRYAASSRSLLPGVYSFKDNSVNFNKEACDTFNVKFPASRTKNGLLLDDGISGNWNSLRQIAGVPFNPLSSVPDVHGDNPPELGERESNLLTEVVGKLTDGYVESSIELNGISKSGAPTFATDLADKMAILKNSLINFHDWTKVLRSGVVKGNSVNYSLWYKVTRLPFCYLEARRSQSTEKIHNDNGKWSARLRKVTDWTSKLVIVDRATQFKNMFAERIRLIYAPSGELNYVLQFMARSMSKFMAYRYRTLTVHNMKELDPVFDGFSKPVAMDVTNFDWSMTPKLVQLVINSILSLNEDGKNWMRFFSSLPFIKKNDYVGGVGFEVHGDFDKKTVEVGKYGNPSGWAFVTVMTKYVGIYIMISVLIKAGIIARNEVQLALDNKHPRVRLMNMGDDGVFLVKYESDRVALNDALQSGYHPIFTLDIEDPAKFLGYNFYGGSTGNKVEDTILDVRNFLTKVHVRERDYNVLKAFPMWGFWIRMREYEEHRRFEELFASYKFLIKKHFKVPLEILTKMADIPFDKLAHVSEADKAFLNDPAVIHYKVLPEDVSPTLLAQVYKTVEYERTVDVCFNQSRRFTREELEN